MPRTLGSSCPNNCHTPSAHFPHTPLQRTLWNCRLQHRAQHPLQVVLHWGTLMYGPSPAAWLRWMWMRRALEVIRQARSFATHPALAIRHPRGELMHLAQLEAGGACPCPNIRVP